NERPGAMAAIIGLPIDTIRSLCEGASDVGTVAPANLNTPTQNVVSGEDAAVMKVIELAEAASAEKAIRLQVGAAFHSELMGLVRQVNPDVEPFAADSPKKLAKFQERAGA